MFLVFLCTYSNMSTDQTSGSTYEQPPKTYPKPNTTQGHYPYPENHPPSAGYGYSAPQTSYGIPMTQYPPTYVPATQSSSQTTIVVNNQPRSIAGVDVTIKKYTHPALVGVSIFCFFPLGIFGLFAALQARDNLKQQKYDDAIKWGNIAKRSYQISATFSVVWVVIAAVFITRIIVKAYYMAHYTHCKTR